MLPSSWNSVAFEQIIVTQASSRVTLCNLTRKNRAEIARVNFLVKSQYVTQDYLTFHFNEFLQVSIQLAALQYRQLVGQGFGICNNRFLFLLKEKPHKCTMCSKSFPTPGDLKSHTYVHTGTWPFKCHICQRGFSKQTNLKNHLLLHSGKARKFWNYE